MRCGAVRGGGGGVGEWCRCVVKCVSASTKRRFVSDHTRRVRSDFSGAVIYFFRVLCLCRQWLIQIISHLIYYHIISVWQSRTWSAVLNLIKYF